MSLASNYADLPCESATRHLDKNIRRLHGSVASNLTLPRPLPTPRQLQESPEIIEHRYHDIITLRQDSEFVRLDTPSASISRICEFICANDPNQIMLEMQYFWSRSSWTLSSIPDPADSDVQRYAVLASLVESLVAAFNFRLNLGLRRDEGPGSDPESCPSWVSKVPALRDQLHLWPSTENAFETQDFHNLERSDPFSKRNIVANAGNLGSI